MTMMNKQQWGLLGSAGVGAGLGAGLMYLLDPQGGRRRRAVAKDKTVHVLKSGSSACLKTSRDLGNRSKGMVLGAASKLRREHPDATTLADRVRSQLGRVVSHPSSLNVMADESGRVVLTGSVLGPEHDRLLKTVRKVKGVKDVEDRTYVYQEASNVPELQGDGSRASWLAQRSWRPSSRLLAGTALGVAGLGLLARELTNRRSRSAGDTGTDSQAVDLHKTIYVDAPVHEVFELWANFETFPRFMSNVLEVRDLGEGRSHWVVRGPAGSRLEWDAEVTRFEPNRVLAWQTEPGAVVESSGLVHFEREGDSTRVQVHMSYHPPAGVLGHGIASLLGSDPEKLMDEDLVRFKSLAEDGKTTARGETVRRDEVESNLHQSQLEPVHF
ncbi:MAG TPA: SRPBCC family protein [Thermoanaerobaculia bacterium]|nr:SRPBCC family protein [Thermoanaerobaculia bacterium]